LVIVGSDFLLAHDLDYEKKSEHNSYSILSKVIMTEPEPWPFSKEELGLSKYHN
jgi:hypothetical protein